MNGADATRVVVVNVSGEVSGAEIVALRLIGRALADRREIVVASPAGPLVAALPPGVRHVELPPAGRGGVTGRVRRAGATARWLASWPVAARRLAREVRGPGTRTVVNSLLAVPVTCLARPASAVWLAHDVVASPRQRTFARGALHWPIVAVSEAAAEPLRALGGAVTVAPNGVAWPVEKAPVLERRPPVVGSLGLLAGWKGQRTLLDAVAWLPGLRVELVGGHFTHDVAYVDSLRARAAAPDLAGRVAFLGHCPDALARIRQWDVFVSASTSPEAGPMTVIEAMSVGVPVVATAHGGPLQYLADGRGELVVPGDPASMADGIARLLADPARRRLLGERGREFVAQHYDLDATFDRQYAAVIGP